jgi:serine/threonine protein kinase
MLIYELMLAILTCPFIFTRRYDFCRKGGPVSAWNVSGKYEITEFLGEGSYGQVCRARLTNPSPTSPQTVVIKRIIDIFHVRQTCVLCFTLKSPCVLLQSPDDAKRCLREIAILRRLNHPNVIKVCCAFFLSFQLSYETIARLSTFCNRQVLWNRPSNPLFPAEQAQGYSKIYTWFLRMAEWTLAATSMKLATRLTPSGTLNLFQSNCAQPCRICTAAGSFIVISNPTTC